MFDFRQNILRKLFFFPAKKEERKKFPPMPIAFKTGLMLYCNIATIFATINGHGCNSTENVPFSTESYYRMKVKWMVLVYKH